MFKITTKKIELGGKTLTLETGKIARQANGSVLVTYGQTSVLCTVTAASSANEDQGFFPLTVNYQEKTYAAGKIPGGFFKREGRNTEKETLTSRLIDRPIRPLFPEGYRNETQVICTVISYDFENDPDIAAIIGSSAALAISEIPFNGPISAARVGLVGGEFTLNPTNLESAESQLDLVVAGTKDSIMMVESSASELIENDMLEALKFAQESFAPVVDLINELQQEAGKEKWDNVAKDTPSIATEISKDYSAKITEAYKTTEKKARKEKLALIKAKLTEKFANEETSEETINSIIYDLEKKIVRDMALSGSRIDGRSLEDIRNIETEVGLFPRVHGSALFTRGETQSLSFVTLGTADDEQIVDSLAGDDKDKFILHYNFPPYSVGEVSPLRAPGRREIGHGKLAKRALNYVLPADGEFGYTVRVVSEITESNGSSSMATVCASSLALMQAGVPIKKPVAGIAMGLILEQDNFAVLSDIMGDEDHLGDMDFKVAGTEDGITALQMDIKVPGITFDIITKALAQAYNGRIHILQKMSQSITKPNTELSEFVPIITSFQIPEKKIRDVIGSGGKVIRKICDDFDVKVFIEDSGQVAVSGVGKETVERAVDHIKSIIEEAEIGKVYSGKVEKTTDYGAFVSFLGNAYGLIHISEFAEGHVESVAEFVKEGDEIKFRVIGRDGDKLRLSFRSALDESIDEEEFKENYKANRKSFSDRNGNRKPSRGRGGNNNNNKDRRPRSKPNKKEDSEDRTEGKKKKRGFFW